jgi:hypothetical protein
LAGFVKSSDLARRGLGEPEEEPPELVGHQPQQRGDRPAPIGRMRVF